MHPHPPALDVATTTLSPTTPSLTTTTIITTGTITLSADSTTTTPNVEIGNPDLADPDSAHPHAIFQYPISLLTLNNIDVVQVCYESIWNNVNLTVFCETTPPSDKTLMAQMNQLKPNGTYAVGPIQAEMPIDHFPTYCNFMLCDAENKSDSITGAGFTMISTQGVPTTYALAATQAGPAPTSTSSPTSISRTSHSASTSTSSSTGAAAVSSSKPTEIPISSIHDSSGLSSGAKAGIAIGVIFGISALIALMILVFLRLKRRMDGLENMVALRSTASSVIISPSEKAAMANSLPTSPLPPSPSPDGPRMAVFKVSESRRNSEDWRRFFGNGKPQ